MKHLVAGTAGHIDHGKTVLVKALTGIDTDRLIEEKRRGISIELGYAYLDLPDGSRVGLVDVPGHERFVRTMVAGAAGIDFVILVVAADDSVMPQTREHLAILDLLGLREGLVALTKTDLVDSELVELVELETREAVAGTFLAEAPIVPCSGITGDGIEALRATIAEVAARVPERGVEAPARVPIDRSFTVAGHGTVVTGTVVNGTLAVGETVEILPRGAEARLRGLEVHGQSVQSVRAGQRAALNLAGVKHDELSRGDVVCARRCFAPTLMVDGLVRLLADAARPLEHGTSVAFHLGTSEVAGRLALLDAPELPPGGEALAQVRLAEPVVARRGDHFILRTVGGDATLGGGEVLDAHPLKHRRHRADAAEALGLLIACSLADAVAHELDKAAVPLRLSALVPLLAERRDRVEAACGDAVRAVPAGGDAWLYTDALLGRARQRTSEALARRHAAKPLLDTGLTPAELAAKIDPTRQLTEDVVSAMMSELVAEGLLREAGGTYALASHRVELSAEQTAIRQAILDACQARPFAPPTEADLRQELRFPDGETAGVYESMLRSGDLVDCEVCGFHPEAVAAAWAKLEAYLKEHGAATISEFRDLLGTTRRYALGLMTCFDAEGKTVRDGDVRRLPG